MRKWPAILDKSNYLKNLEKVLSSDIWTIRAQRNSYYFTQEFEKQWADFCGHKHALLTSSGFSSLEICLRALELHQGDEVIVPALGWYATAAAVTKVGATPIFCDVEVYTTCIDAQKVRTLITPNTRALIAVHLHSSFSPLRELREICNENNIVLLEDASQAHGGTYEGKAPGHFSIAACFSFNQEKLIPAGEGGAIVTNCREFYEKIYAIRTDGYIYNQEKQDWVPSGIVGGNYASSEFQAAVLLGSLKEFEYFQLKRQQTLKKVGEILSSVKELSTIFSPSLTTRPFCYELGLMFSPHFLAKYNLDFIIEKLNSFSMVQVGRTDIPVPYNPLFNPYYKNKPIHFDIENALNVYKSLVVIHHQHLLDDEILKMCFKLREWISESR